MISSFCCCLDFADARLEEHWTFSSNRRRRWRRRSSSSSCIGGLAVKLKRFGIDEKLCCSSRRDCVSFLLFLDFCLVNSCQCHMVVTLHTHHWSRYHIFNVTNLHFCLTLDGQSGQLLMCKVWQWNWEKVLMLVMKNECLENGIYLPQFWWIAWCSLFVKMCVGNKSNSPRAETMAESQFLPYHILTNNP